MSAPSAPDAIDRRLGRPRVMAEAERRQHIADAAASVFCRKGYWATTMDDVSRQAGMSKKTLYQLFSSKADIFDLLLRSFTAPFTETFDPAGRPPREVLTDGLVRLATIALSEKQIELTRVLIAEAGQPGDVADAIDEHSICRGDWALKQWFATQRQCGALVVDDPDKLASTIFWAVIGDFLITTLLRVRPRPCPGEIAEQVARVVGWLYADAA